MGRIFYRGMSVSSVGPSDPDLGSVVRHTKEGAPVTLRRSIDIHQDEMRVPNIINRAIILGPSALGLIVIVTKAFGLW